MGVVLVRGGTVVCGNGLVRGTLTADGDQIVAIESSHRAGATGGVVVDASGCSVLPGFVDLQVNGAVGVDLTVSPQGIDEVAELLPRCGITSFMPTVISSPLDAIDTAVTVVHEWAQRVPAGSRGGARSLGMHVEGPFLNPTRKGAHPAQHLRVPTQDAAHGWRHDRGVAMVTIAPELDGALAVIEQLAAAGVVVCAGHTDADPAQLELAVAAGARGVTHLFNAMGPMTARSPGPAGAAMAHPTLIAGLIVDGIHVDPAMVRLAWRALGPDRLALVSDAMAALGLAHGTYAIGDTEVVVDGSGARTAAGVLAGSVLRFDEGVRNLMAFTGCDIVAAARAASTTPARLAGRADIGELAPGRRADFVILDDEQRVVLTMVDGRVVWDPDGRCEAAGRAGSGH